MPRPTISLPLLAGGCALLLYLPFLSQRYDATGVIDALAVDAGGTSVWNPNHLLYRPLAIALVAASRTLGYEGRSMATLQVLSAFCGAVTVGLVMLIGLRLTRDRWAAAMATGLLAVGWAQWSASTDASYMPLAAASAAAAVACSLTAAPTLRSCCGAGALYAVAMLTWQANVFLLPVLIVRPVQGGAARTPQLLAVFVGSAALLVLAGYTAAAHWAGVTGGLRPIAQWASRYGGEGSGALPLWGVWSLDRIGWAAHAWISSLLPVWEGLGLRALSRGVVRQDTLLRQLAGGATLLVLAASLARAWRLWRGGRLPVGTIAWLAAGGLAYLPFLVWWDPGAPKWFVVVNLFAVGALGLVWIGVGRAARTALVLAIATIAAANFSATIWPAHRGTSPHDALARCVAARLQPQDVILITEWGWYDHARYWYAPPAEFLSLIDNRPAAGKVARIAAAIDRTRLRGGRVYMMELDRSVPERVAWLRVLTRLAPADIDRFAPRPAFTCAGVPFAELTSTGADGGGPSSRR
jgi:hypothetical protein